MSRTAAACREGLGASFDAMLSIWSSCIRAGGKILFFGNGGSAAGAQHLAAELPIRYCKDRAPIAAIALTTDSSSSDHAAGNDLGFDDRIFRAPDCGSPENRAMSRWEFRLPGEKPGSM